MVLFLLMLLSQTLIFFCFPYSLCYFKKKKYFSSHPETTIIGCDTEVKYDIKNKLDFIKILCSALF